MTSLINDVIESVNQDQNLIYQLQNQLLINTSSLRIVQFHWSSFYLSARHTSSIIVRVNIYLFDNLLQQLHEHLHYSSKYLTKTYAFARQIDAFSSVLFERLLNFFEFDFVSLVMTHSTWKRQKSNTYEKRLASLKNSHWFSRHHSKEVMIVAEFDITDLSDFAECTSCWYWFMQSDCEKSLTKHSLHCSLFKQLHKEVVKRVELKKIEELKTSKFISVAVDIEYFDSTLLCDIQKFDLFCEIANFVQQLRQCQHQYRESNLLTLLIECFRDSALIWYKKQSEIVKKNLSEWLEVLITTFSAKSLSEFEVFASNSSVSRLSSQYHFCLNCFASFSSLTRLLQHTQEIVCKKVVCKHCEKIFDSKNKLHEYLRQHHTTKKIVKVVSRRSFNRERDKISSTISQTTSSILSQTTTKFSIFRFVTLSESSRNASLINSSTLKNESWYWYKEQSEIVKNLSVSSQTTTKFSIFKSVTFSESSRNASLTNSSTLENES